MLNVLEAGVAPLEDTPEGTKFYRVLRFDSIADMKRATEQVMTKDFAEKIFILFLTNIINFLKEIICFIGTL